MDEYESLSYTKWECKYHAVFIRKGRHQAPYGQMRQPLGEVFGRFAEQKESRDETVIREYIRTRSRGQAVGPAEPVAKIGHRQGGH